MFSSPLLPFILTRRARSRARALRGENKCGGWEATCLPPCHCAPLWEKFLRARLVLQQQQRLSEGGILCGSHSRANVATTLRKSFGWVYV